MVLLFLVGCSGGRAGGSSSETTNGVVASVQNSVLYGKAEENSLLMLYSSDYNAVAQEGFADTLVPQNDETFSFGMLESGNYNLYALDSSREKSLLICSVAVDDRAYRYEALFTPGGSVEGVMTLTYDTDVAGLCLVGTPFVVPLGADGSYLFEDIPAGDYTLQAWVYTDITDPVDDTGVVDTLDGTTTTPGGDPITTLIGYDTEITVYTDSTITLEQ